MLCWNLQQMETSPKHSWATRAFARTRIFRRPIYIFWISLLAVCFFAFTFGVSRLYAKKQHELSVYWFQRGENALAEGNPREAISDLRTALLYSHDDPRYLFTLAQALEADNRIAEARSYFLNLLEDEPGNGSVNLELARLAARQNDVNHALRYFNGAVYGAWDSDPILKRQQVRQELIHFLLSKDLKTQARGELLTFTAEMPKNETSELWVAQAFSRLSDDRSALDFYKAALRANLHDRDSLEGAGDAAFHLGRYSEALDYYKRAAADGSEAALAQKIQLASLVLDLNPFESRIPSAERRHRLILAMDIADHRLRQCAQLRKITLDAPGSDPLQVARSQWLQLDSQIRGNNHSHLVELLTPVTNLILNIEQQSGCGPAVDTDQAALRVYQNAAELQP